MNQIRDTCVFNSPRATMADVWQWMLAVNTSQMVHATSIQRLSRDLQNTTLNLWDPDEIPDLLSLPGLQEMITGEVIRVIDRSFDDEKCEM